MKTKLFILLLAVSLFALEGYSPYKLYDAGDTLTYQNLDSNLVRGSDWSDNLVDTLDREFVRFSDIDDSSFSQMSIDTIDADTITAEKVTTETIAVGAGGIKSAAPCTSTVFNASSSTASRVVTTDANKNLSSATTTTTEVNLLSGKNSVIDGSGTSGNIPVFSGTSRIANGPVWNSGTSTATMNITGVSGSCNGNSLTSTTSTRSDSLSKPFYTDTTFNDSLYEGGVWTGTYATVRFVKIGRMCMLFQPQMVATSSGGLLTINGIPSKYLTTLSATGGIVTTIRNNGTDTNGLIWFYNGAVRILKENGANTDTGTSGITSSFLYWIIF